MSEEGARPLGDVPAGRVCPYDGAAPELVDSSVLYSSGRSYGPAWRCPRCGAYVGCHPGTTRPLGRLADARLRAAKKSAHAVFDTLWKGRIMTRAAAYAWLSQELGLPKELCHIGMMDAEQCEEVAALALARLRGQVKA